MVSIEEVPQNKDGSKTNVKLINKLILIIKLEFINKNLKNIKINKKNITVKYISPI